MGSFYFKVPFYGTIFFTWCAWHPFQRFSANQPSFSHQLNCLLIKGNSKRQKRLDRFNEKSLYASVIAIAKAHHHGDTSTIRCLKIHHSQSNKNYKDLKPRLNDPTCFVGIQHYQTQSLPVLGEKGFFFWEYVYPTTTTSSDRGYKNGSHVTRFLPLQPQKNAEPLSGMEHGSPETVLSKLQKVE